jgi:hypothetical protein
VTGITVAACVGDRHCLKRLSRSSPHYQLAEDVEEPIAKPL